MHHLRRNFGRQHRSPFRERYGFDNVHTALAARLDPRAGGDPWWIFVYASQHNLQSLAKSAIAELGSSKKWRMMTFNQLPSDRFEDVPYNYTIPFVRAIQSNELEANGWGQVKVDWSEAAKDFRVSSS